MDYFRAIIQKDERSQRALDLTTAVLQQNAANYTAWYYRALLIKDLDVDAASELEFVASIADDNAKNYQIWHHRRLILERLGDKADGAAELAFTTSVLEDDEDQKNYHAWAHRQWVLQTYQLWDGELDYIVKLLQQDRRNNSAWNQRYFVLRHTRDLNDAELIEAEIAFAFTYIAKAPNNQSPWNYVRGISRRRFAEFPALLERTKAVTEKAPTCANAYSLLVDIYLSQHTPDATALALEVRQCCSIPILSTRSLTRSTRCILCMQACNRLPELDPLRKKYWIYRAHEIQKLLTTTTTAA